MTGISGLDVHAASATTRTFSVQRATRNPETPQKTKEKGPRRALAFPRSPPPPSGNQFSAFCTLVKVVLSFEPKALHDRDDGDRDARRDQAVLDGRGARLVLHKLLEHRHSILPLVAARDLRPAIGLSTQRPLTAGLMSSLVFHQRIYLNVTIPGGAGTPAAAAICGSSRIAFLDQARSWTKRLFLDQARVPGQTRSGPSPFPDQARRPYGTAGLRLALASQQAPSRPWGPQQEN